MLLVFINLHMGNTDFLLVEYAFTGTKENCSCPYFEDKSKPVKP